MLAWIVYKRESMCGVIFNFSRLVNLLQILVFVVFSDQN